MRCGISTYVNAQRTPLSPPPPPLSPMFPRPLEPHRERDLVAQVFADGAADQSLIVEVVVRLCRPLCLV